MTIKPLCGQVLVELDAPDKFTAGGIEIPGYTLSPEDHQQAARRPTPPPGVTGIVKSIGAWPKTRSGLARMPEFGVGAKVIIGPHTGLEMQRSLGERMKMVRNEQVLAVLT